MQKAIIIFLFLSSFLRSQNLVPNWSFETYSSCPSVGSEIYYATPWFGPQTNSTDYFNSCSSIYGVPNCGGDYQQAKDGSAFAGLYLKAGGSTYREYAQVQLTATLAASSCYYTEFFINMAGYSGTAVNNASAHFSNLPYTTTGTANELGVIPHITNYGNPIISDTLNWVKVSGVYVANGTESYITIGNFKNDASTTMSVIPTGFVNVGYYYIDAVSVYSLNPSGPFPWSYSNATINFGDSVYIGNTMGGSFNSDWYTLPGPTFVKNAPGFYTKPAVTNTYVVTYTICGVANSNTLTVTVNGVGINELGVQSSEFVVSPNPNNGLLTVEISNKEFVIEDASLRIVNVIGEVLKKEKLSANPPAGEAGKQQFDLSELPNGIYLLQLQQKERIVAVKKIIKQ